MVLFLLGMAILVAGYFTYGKFIEKIIVPTDRETPAISRRDGVDFLVLPNWKNALIQLLNIAGIGPVIGVILGIKFGEIVFIIIPFGNIIGGAVHDYLAGMMSIRKDGANMPQIIRDSLGKNFFGVYSVFMCFLLLLVVAVFINVPASLIDGFFPENPIFWWAVAAIFIYYISATIFPVDKIIGAIYPIFGVILLAGSGAILISVLWSAFQDPSLLAESAGFKERMYTTENNNPIIPVLFVTIACGIISGFHATQAPIVARTMDSERRGKGVFYGMMILEGIIAMTWAAASIALYNIAPEYMDLPPTSALRAMTEHFLGSWVGGLTIVGVIILAITSGDTALRSLRLSVAEIFKVGQKSLAKRFLVCAPLIAIVCVLLAWSNASAESFKLLWNYFAWGNQVLAACTLMAAAVVLFSKGKPGWVALIPGMFMTFIVLTYILWISPKHGGPAGFGLSLDSAYVVGAVLTVVLAAWIWKRGKNNSRKSN